MPPPSPTPTFKGCFYPHAPVQRASYRDLTRNELSSFITTGRFDGLPVVVEHDESNVVGRVDRAYIDSSGSAHCEFSAIGDPQRVAEITERIRSRQLSEMSLHHVLSVIDVDGGITVDPDRPIRLKEISLTKKGARRGTNVSMTVQMSEGEDGRPRGSMIIESVTGDVEEVAPAPIEAPPPTSVVAPVVQPPPACNEDEFIMRREGALRRCKSGIVFVAPTILDLLDGIPERERSRYRHLSALHARVK